MMKLTAEGCRERRQAFRRQMLIYGVSEVVLSDPRHVLYLSGFETPEHQHSALLLDARGRSALICGVSDPVAAVDEIVTVASSVHSTLHLDHARKISEAVGKRIGPLQGLLGHDRACFPSYLEHSAEGAVDLSSILFEMRRRKWEDELALIRTAVRINEACFERAREIVLPGVSEIEIYSELYKTATLTAGEKLQAFGNDFQSGTAGGPPRQREIQSGELFILDLGTRWGGYYGDSCRTFSVGDVSERQRSAWTHVVEALRFVEETAVPGYACRKLFEEVRQRLDRHWSGGFSHHLGHGVGLAPHERPNLNPHWNHNLEDGDVISVEPGVYASDLRGGIRLEEMYRVTPTGLEKLTTFPLDL